MAQAPVKRVLLCRPTHFNVEYIINPHMKPYTVETAKALNEWDDLVATLKYLKIRVQTIEQEMDVPDMVFAVDQGIVRDGAVLMANFRYTQRQSERIYYRDWFRDNGFKLRALSNIYPFEGGDTIFFGEMLFVGTGFRASVSSCEELANKLGVDVIPLRLVDPYFYHLDMCFLPIDETTAFYYPKAFSKNSQNLIKRMVPNLIELTKDEVDTYAANSFVSGKDIVISKGIPNTFHKKLKKLDLNIHEVKIDEFKKAGGGIHCLINVLE